MLLAIAGAWADLVEQAGDRFHVVLLPREDESIAQKLFEDRFAVINLYKIFSGMRPGYKYDMIRFRVDQHWDETGNMLAAIALHREISKLLGRAPANEQTITTRLRAYYSAFDGWYPAELAQRLPFSAELQVIRDRYLALETETAGRSARHAEATDAGRAN